MHGPVCINGTWQIKSNREMESLHNRPDIMAKIKSRRIGKWKGAWYHRKSWMGDLRGKEALGDQD
jgi:hypothetical protein